LLLVMIPEDRCLSYCGKWENKDTCFWDSDRTTGAAFAFLVFLFGSSCMMAAIGACGGNDPWPDVFPAPVAEPGGGGGACTDVSPAGTVIVVPASGMAPIDVVLLRRRPARLPKLVDIKDSI
jgi:hypothetical protein